MVGMRILPYRFGNVTQVSLCAMYERKEKKRIYHTLPFNVLDTKSMCFHQYALNISKRTDMHHMNNSAA